MSFASANLMPNPTCLNGPAKTGAENTHYRGKDHCTAGLQFNKIGLDQKERICCYLCVVKQLKPNL